MSRLYLRFYLAVLGSLMVFAILAGLAAVTGRLFDDDHRRPFPERGAEIAERLLPVDESTAKLQQELEYWQERTGYSVMLIGRDGQIIALAGEFPEDFRVRGSRHRNEGFWRGRRGLYGLTLSDGRRLVAMPPDRGPRYSRYFGWLAGLLGIGIAVAIAAYPLVRQLTRRLERLEQGVAEFGKGDLTARVDIPGRDEIARLGETFNASADRIEALLIAHKTLLANASHELRSPLSRLRMALERLPEDGASQQTHSEIAKNIEELDELVGEVLLASRLQANSAGIFSEETIDIIGLLAEECAAYDAELSFADGTTIFVVGDARLLRRVFRNLLDNATRYGGGDPPSVMASIEGSLARISVCDRGPGIPEAERDKIFEPFYRMQNVPESVAGTGLGLALVRQITERHSGKVACQPRDGGGSCFMVQLPAQIGTATD